jgi:pre-mRNA-splicing factor ATP-dependent RNA helicase DHX15/PRP43
MADRRHADDEENGRAKRQKTTGSDMNPKANPYLAHMYDDQGQDDGGYSNGYNGRKDDLLQGLTRHETTAEQAKVAEDGPYNPFTGEKFSKRYLSILKTRRNLPVHAQRYVHGPLWPSNGQNHTC